MGVYDNPYLPPFVAQRPRVEPVKAPPQLSIPGSVNYSQIQPVNGFAGARAFAANLAVGSSAIIAESDPNIARVYIVAKDANNQTIVEGYRLIREEEPKPVTMDDLSAQMSELLNRMNKLEEDQHANKSVSESTRKNVGTTAPATPKSQSNGHWNQQPAGNDPASASK